MRIVPILSMATLALDGPPATAQARSETVVIIGCVADSATGTAVESVRIVMPGVVSTAVTDSTGFFEIRIGRNIRPTVLEGRRIGYASRQVPLTTVAAYVVAAPLIELAVSATADTFGSNPLPKPPTPQDASAGRDALLRLRAQCAARAAAY